MKPIHHPEVIARTAEAILREQQRRQDAKPENIRRFYADPLEFVKWGWRWGLPGPLERFSGPDTWQKEFLIDLGEQVRARNFNGRDPVDPIRMTVSSGHGVGKSALAGWLVTWIMSTRKYSQGTITANTFTQLETKTWASIQHWFGMCRTARDFYITSSGIKHRQFRESWKCTPQTCKEENSEAFAGQHAATSTSFYLFDEASSIPEIIWQVAEGGLSDVEPMLFAFGNPTRSSGKFWRINFGDDRKRWIPRTIDARECAFPNKKQIAEWIEDYGEDSDFVRVRVKGLPPRGSDLQYIDSERVYAAQKRTFEVLDDEPLVAGVDLARGGGDKAVIRFRRGDDARTIPPIKIPGELVRDSTLLIAKLADMAMQKFNGIPVHTWFVDGTGVGGPIVDRLKQLGHENFVEVQFGEKAPDDKHYANMRAWMWSQMRDWLGNRGAIDNDRMLETDLTGVGLGKPDKTDRIVLESKDSMKKRGLASPDDGDALAMTFAAPVKPKMETVFGSARSQWDRGNRGEHSWMRR